MKKHIYIDAKLHRLAKIEAAKLEIDLCEFVEKAISEKIQKLAIKTK